MSSRKRIREPDEKIVRTYVNSTNTAGVIQHVSVIPRGTTSTSRIGSTATITGIRWRSRIRANVNYSSTLTTRFMLVWDSNPNQALPAITDVLDTATWNSFEKDENATRFSILFDSTKAQVVAGVGALTDSSHRFESGTLDLLGDVRYTAADTTGVIGNCVEGALYYIGVCDSVESTIYQCNVEVTFVD